MSDIRRQAEDLAEINVSRWYERACIYEVKVEINDVVAILSERGVKVGASRRIINVGP